MAHLSRVFACLLAFLIAAPAMAEKRVALVIGNAAYQHAPALANPKHDAEGMAEALRALKFEVLLGVDLDKPGIERLMQAFAEKVDGADVALVFFAGHGLQVNGRNYIVPVSGKLDRESDLLFHAVPLDSLQQLLEQGQRTNILILDACRDNPLARNLARSMGTRSSAIGRGLGETKAGIGTLIVYATQPGNVALDGQGRNSPFTEAMLKHLRTPGLEVRQILTRVRAAVIETTKGKQVPWDSSSLTGDFFFTPAAAPAPAPSPGVTPPAVTSPDPKRSARAPGSVFRDCTDCPEMVVIPLGDFLMGSSFDEKDRFPDEGPQHRVTLAKPFTLAKYETTRTEFSQFAGETGVGTKACRVWQPARNNFAPNASANWQFPGFEQSGQHPVVCVSWSEAKAFADWLAKKTGKPYRLPSEAEWEYAARAGTRSAWTWGPTPGDGCNFANGADQSYTRQNRGSQGLACDDGFAFTAPVGSHRSNAFGLHDTIGNASEWTADCWRESFAGAPNDGSAWTSGTCKSRTTRGGAWLANARLLRSAVRGGEDGEDRLNILGFRVARDLEPAER
jgi:formylglycine-generating enzyme required for sulfatase activity